MFVELPMFILICWKQDKIMKHNFFIFIFELETFSLLLPDQWILTNP